MQNMMFSRQEKYFSGKFLKIMTFTQNTVSDNHINAKVTVLHPL